MNTTARLKPNEISIITADARSLPKTVIKKLSCGRKITIE